MTENHSIGKQNDDGIKCHTFLTAFNYKVPTIFLPFQLLDLTIPSCF